MTFQPSSEGYFINLNNVDYQQKTFITLPNSSLLNFGSNKPFTVAVWVRTTTDFSASTKTSIVANKDYDSSKNPGWTLGVGNDGRFEFNIADGSER